MSQTFHVILTAQPDGGFFIECPSLPGCYTQSDMREEALVNIREAFLIALDDLEVLGQHIPETSLQVVTEVSISR